MAKLTFSNYGDEMLSPHQKLQEQAKYLVAYVQEQLNNYKSHRSDQPWQTLGVELVINPETWAKLREVDHPQVGLYPNRLCGQPVIQSYDLPTDQVRVLLSAIDPQLAKAKNSGWVSAGGSVSGGMSNGGVASINGKTGTVSITSGSNNTWSVTNGSPPGHGIGGGGGGSTPSVAAEYIPSYTSTFYVDAGHLMLSDVASTGYVSTHDLGTGPPLVINASWEKSTYEVYTQNGQTWKLTGEVFDKLLKACDKVGWKINDSQEMLKDTPSYGLDATIKKQLDGKLQGKTKKQLNVEIKEKIKADSQTWITNPTTGEMKELPLGEKISPGWLETVMPEPKPENIVQFGEFQIGPIHSVPKPESFVVPNFATTTGTNQLADEISKMKEEINTLLVAKQDSEAALNELQATLTSKKSVIDDDIWQTKAKQNGKTTASKKAMVGQTTPAGVIIEYNVFEDTYTLLVENVDGPNPNKTFTVMAEMLEPLVKGLEGKSLPKISAEDIYHAVKATKDTVFPIKAKKGSKKPMGGSEAFQSLLDTSGSYNTWLPGDSPHGDEEVFGLTEDEAADDDEEPW